MEIVGIGLAILPLLISAAEHYDTCLRPIRRYRKIVVEIHRFQRHLQVHKTIFQNQCRILLESATEHHTAVQMLKLGSNDPSWRSIELEIKLTKHLGASRDACLTIVELIDEKLQSIAKESSDMQALVDGTPLLKHRVAKKLRFSLSQSRLDEYIKSLRNLNDDFTKLSNQTNNAAINETQDLKAQRRPYETEIATYRAIGESSEKVYKALGSACNQHPEHIAHFCVSPVAQSADEIAVSPTKFHIAFPRLPQKAEFEISSNSRDNLLLWFKIDTVKEQAPNEALPLRTCSQR